MSELIQIHSTFPNKSEAEKVSDILLQKKLAACIQTLGPTESKFWWEGKVDIAKEYLMLIKTTQNNFEEIQSIIKEYSSYELPEIIAVPIIAGSEEYLDWFKRNTK